MAYSVFVCRESCSIRCASPPYGLSSHIGQEFYDMEAMYRLRILREVASRCIPCKTLEDISVELNCVWRLAFGLAGEDVPIDET